MFVHNHGMPDEKAVQNLSVYLGKLTSYFLDKEYNAPCMEELCIGFFYYCIKYPCSFAFLRSLRFLSVERTVSKVKLAFIY